MLPFNKMRGKIYEKTYFYKLRATSLTPPQRSFFIAIFLLLIVLPLSAQEETAPQDFWFGLGSELNIYSPTGLSLGVSLAAAYGSGTSMGIKLSCFFDLDGNLNVLEINFLFRLYLFGKSANYGPFLHLEGGPAIFFNSDETVSFPARLGMINLGLAFGWRFLLGKNFFIEPLIRGGYPYIFGAGVLAGMRF